MNPSPKEIAETLLEGGRIAHTLSTEHLEDVIFHIQRKLDGETGYKLLISEKTLPVLYNALQAEPGSAFHTMALRQLERCASNQEGVNFLASHQDLIGGQLKAFLDEDFIGGYEIVNRTILEMAKKFENQTIQIFFDSTNSKWSPVFDQQLANASETIRVRLLDLFASLTAVSQSWFELMNARGYVAKIFDELDNEDLLARLSAFQLLGKICSSTRGLNEMKANDVPQKLLAMLDLDSSGLNGIVLSNCVTLIGEIAAANSDSFSILIGSHPAFVPALSAHLEHENDEVVQAIIFALSRMCCTPEGLAFLLQDTYKNTVRDWLEYGHSSNAEMKATVFYSLANVLQRIHAVDSTSTNVRTLYSRLGFTDYPSIEVINKSLSGALSELKYAALTLLKETVKFDWGIEEFIRLQGLSDWMTNRSTENTKKGHELKYEVLHTAIQHPQAKALLGLNNFHVFLEYIKLGVYYQRAEHAVKIRDEHA